MTQQKRETTEVAAATRRMLRAWTNRVASGEIDNLRELVDFAAQVDTAIAAAVAGLRAEPNSYSWADIGKELDISRQAAFQRWPNVGGRSVGGQPQHLR